MKTLALKGLDQSKVELVVQTPNPDPISWANTIRKFNGIGSDIIITYGAPVTLAAIREVDNIPIVFVDVYGPVEAGVTRSMAAPGRNLTGVSSKVPMITLIKAANDIKHIKSLGILYNGREIGSVIQLKEIRRLAAQMGFSVVELNVSSANMLDSALGTLTSSDVDFIYAAESTLVTRSLEKVIFRARDHGIPVISHVPEAADKGALVTLEINTYEQGQLAGECVSAILQGKKQGQIPVATPKKVDLVINLKAAKLLDLNVPIQVLNISTKIVK
ncbi:ABC transporter substrate-binding protein [Geotalea daltonii]|uniref:ABC transporter substrate-binding protein n=1 Tax=Geotalea daltonii TaxID=1203471 RepID=UPI0002DA2C91|nr:ABC transporter substrate-binding protein [Geotalea daltonii]